MKVLNVNAVLDPVTGGGTAARTLQMTQALQRVGVECSILTTNAGLGRYAPTIFDGVRVTAYPCLWQRFFVPRTTYSAIAKEVSGADVIHLMGHWSVLNGLVYLAARAAGIPYVVCPAGALPIYGRSRLLKTLYNWIVGRKIIRNANAWIAVTDEERAHFEAYGVHRDKIVVIPNGISIPEVPDSGADRFRTRHNLGENPVVLFVGRLNSIKGPDLLIEAFCRGWRKWPEWHLIFVGPDGGMLHSLQKRAAASAAASHVHFVGYLGGAEKIAAYRVANLLVIPSRQEAMSIVVLEAGVSGTPVLITDKCGFDQVGSVGGGKVVAATVQGIEDGLTAMLADRAGLAVMGNKLEHYVHDHFTWGVIVKKYLEIYKPFFS